MKHLIIASAITFSACTTYKSDNHSIKYTTNYNTNVTPPSRNSPITSNEPRLPDLVNSSEEFKNPEELNMDDVSPLIKSKPLLKKSTVVRTYVEPIRPSAVVPMAGVTPFPRDHWMYRNVTPSNAPQLYFYGY